MSGGDDDNGDGHVETMDESEGLTTEDIVVLVDDEGEEHRFVLLAVVEVESQEYALLAPEDQMRDEEGDEYEVHIFEYEVDDEGLEHFSPIDDEKRYQEVLAFCETLFESEREGQLARGGPDVDEE